MPQDDRPKYACLFCQRTYRTHVVPRSTNLTTINCQYCLVDFFINDANEVVSLEYRLHDPVWNRMLVNLSQQKTWVKLHPKQKKIKNPPVTRQFQFNTARMPQPKDALALAQRLTSLLIFS